MRWAFLISLLFAGNLYAQDITYTHENVYVSIPSVEYQDRRADISYERSWRREKLLEENKTRVEVAYHQSQGNGIQMLGGR